MVKKASLLLQADKILEKDTNLIAVCSFHIENNSRWLHYASESLVC